MPVCEIHLNASDTLGKMTSFMVILPDKKTGPFPVLYLLHGLSDDHTAWTRRTSIERYVSDLPLIVVMPNGERSFYTNSRTEPRAAFETMIVRELIGFVDTTFRTQAEREGRVVAGLSMGGYGALKLALKYPELFRAGASLSGAPTFAHGTYWGQNDEKTGGKSEWGRLLGPDLTGSRDDLWVLAEQSDPKRRPELSIDCGAEDHLLKDNRDFHKHLESVGYPHTYLEYPGAHDWSYWDAHIQDVIRFFFPPAPPASQAAPLSQTKEGES